MQKRSFDYFVIGQGLAGSLLSMRMLQEGRSVLVLDSKKPSASSRIAAGLVHPITGRRKVLTWLADTVLPYAFDFYDKLEAQSGMKLFHEMDILEIVTEISDLNKWMELSGEPQMAKYFKEAGAFPSYQNYLQPYHKLIRIGNSGWLNIPAMLDWWREELRKKDALLHTSVQPSDIELNQNTIRYKEFTAGRIVYCEGASALQQSPFSWLPFQAVKGEILTIHCPGLPEDHILLRGQFILPKGNEMFRVGSTYEWDQLDEETTEVARQKIESQLKRILKLPYTISEQHAGVRPAIRDRRPVIGQHPEFENVFVFNGLGTKGVSLGPFFADQTFQLLDKKIPVHPEVAVSRFHSEFIQRMKAF